MLCFLVANHLNKCHDCHYYQQHKFSCKDDNYTIVNSTKFENQVKFYKFKQKLFFLAWVEEHSCRMKAVGSRMKVFIYKNI